MNRLKNLWSELSGIEKAAEILAFICLVVSVYFIFNGKGAKMIFVLGLILVFNGIGCVRRNPSNCRISVLCGIIVAAIGIL